MRPFLAFMLLAICSFPAHAVDDEIPSGRADEHFLAIGGEGYLPAIGYRPLQILGPDEMLIYPSSNPKSTFWVKGVPTKGVNQEGPWIEFNQSLQKIVFKVRKKVTYKNKQGFERTTVLVSPLSKTELAAFRKKQDAREEAKEAAEREAKAEKEAAVAKKKAAIERARKAAADKERKAKEAAKEAARLKKAEYERDAPARSERSAAAKLKLVKRLVDDGLKDKAILRLQQLVKQYPDTKAAKEAKVMLKDLDK